MFQDFPETIKVGNLRVKVSIQDSIKDEKGNALWGEFDCHDHILRLHRAMPSSGKELEVVLHEILHAIWLISDVRQSDKEERIVSTLATWLATILIDNPQLMRWLECATKM